MCLVLHMRLYHPRVPSQCISSLMYWVRSEQEARDAVDRLRGTITDCDVFWTIFEADARADLSPHLVPLRIVACSISEDWPCEEVSVY